MLFACSCQHMLNTFPFIQRTEQVLIELDISAIEEYVIILLLLSKKSSVNQSFPLCLFLLNFTVLLGIVLFLRSI